MASCHVNREKITIELPASNPGLDDAEFVLEQGFKPGDVRRYGLFPDSINTTVRVGKALELAQMGMPLYFPEGYYAININLKGAQDVTLTFEKAVIGGGLNLLESDDEGSSRIAIKGHLSVLDRVFIRHSSHITFDSLTIVSDTLRNLYKKKNRGLSIYAGTQNLSIQKLKVVETGGEDLDHYRHTAAAVQIYGWNNNPENVLIKEVVVRNAGRTAAYITGNNNQIGSMHLEGFGKGSGNNMAGLDDAPAESEKAFTGLWINKCNDCYFGSVAISGETSASFLRLGPGEAYEPTIIDEVIWENSPALPLEDDLLTNVIIKSVAKNE
jgi:hypothetical protein